MHTGIRIWQKSAHNLITYNITVDTDQHVLRFFKVEDYGVLRMKIYH